MRGFLTASVLLAALVPGAASAAIETDTAITSLFSATCLKGELSLKAREAKILSDPEWEQSIAPNVDTRKFGAVPALQSVGDFDRPVRTRVWTRMVDGKKVRAVLAEFSPKGRYQTLCAIITPDVANALPYWDSFRSEIKALGINGKSTDLPHYQEFAGKLNDGRRARADLYSRTQTVPDTKAMHMYIAFQDATPSPEQQGQR